MQIIPLYKYQRAEGGITVSPIKPEKTEITEAVRIIADEGKMLTIDGINYTQCADVESAEGWFEVDAPDTDLERIFAGQ